jgi:hypothetical protein
VKIIKGQKEPVQGWLPDASLGYGGIRPIPTAVYGKEVRGKATVLYVLYPSPKRAVSPVKGVALDGNTLIVEFNDNRKQTIRFQPYPER